MTEDFGDKETVSFIDGIIDSVKWKLKKSHEALVKATADTSDGDTVDNSVFKGGSKPSSPDDPPCSHSKHALHVPDAGDGMTYKECFGCGAIDKGLGFGPPSPKDKFDALPAFKPLPIQTTGVLPDGTSAADALMNCKHLTAAGKSAVITHKMPDGSVWKRCVRCGSTDKGKGFPKWPSGVTTSVNVFPGFTPQFKNVSAQSDLDGAPYKAPKPDPPPPVKVEYTGRRIR